MNTITKEASIIEYTAQKPSDWGSDSLSEFFETTDKNVKANYIKFSDSLKRLQQIDEIFNILTDSSHDKHLLSLILLMKAQCSFRTATRESLAGFSMEVYVILRACLECGLYALFLGDNEQLEDTWINRIKSKKHNKKMREKFTIGEIFKSLESKNPKMLIIVKRLYNYLIDYGAHPNPGGVLLTSEIIQALESKRIESVYLTENETITKVALENCMRVGICVLDLIYLIFPGRYEILDLDRKLDELRKGL